MKTKNPTEVGLYSIINFSLKYSRTYHTKESRKQPGQPQLYLPKHQTHLPFWLPYKTLEVFLFLFQKKQKP